MKVVKLIKGLIFSPKKTLKSIWRKCHFPSYVNCFYIKNGKYKNLTLWGGSNFYISANDAFKNCLSKEEFQDEVLKRELLRDMLVCYLLYGTSPVEYMLRNFRSKSKIERETYLSRQNKDVAIIEQIGLNWQDVFSELKDKYAFYKIANNFFLRDAFYLNDKSDLDDFSNFINKHNTFIAKPIKGRQGLNTVVYNIKDHESALDLLNHLLVLADAYILEELIVQDERMKELNSTSVNTIRIPSFRTADGFKILAPLLRIGRHGKVVDNVGSGGIMVALDEKTGIACTDGMDECCNIYITHPDSGIVLKGWSCPDWEGLLKFAEEVHKSLPSYHKYVGFDFALSKKGWCIVEGNWGDFECQAPLNRGLKKEFLELLNA